MLALSLFSRRREAPEDDDNPLLDEAVVWSHVHPKRCEYSLKTDSRCSYAEMTHERPFCARGKLTCRGRSAAAGPTPESPTRTPCLAATVANASTDPDIASDKGLGYWRAMADAAEDQTGLVEMRFQTKDRGCLPLLSHIPHPEQAFRQDTLSYRLSTTNYR